MLLDFTELFLKQEELDLEVAKNHNVSYETTNEKRFLALLVELGELANASRCFKYWSNKPSESKERVYDEYVDGLHFLLSLGIANKITLKEFDFHSSTFDLTNLIIMMYESAIKFYLSKDEKDYQAMFEIYLMVADKLGMKKEDIFSSYLLKLDENHRRQENNY